MQRLVVGPFRFNLQIFRGKYNRITFSIRGRNIIVKSDTSHNDRELKEHIKKKLQGYGLNSVSSDLVRKFILLGKPYDVIDGDRTLIDRKNNIIYVNDMNILQMKLYKVLFRALEQCTKNVSKKFSKTLPLIIEGIGSYRRFAYYYNDVIFIYNRVIHLPKYLIEYILTHEYIHSDVKSHNKLFKEMLYTIYPNFRELDKELKKYSIILHYNKTNSKIYQN